MEKQEVIESLCEMVAGVGAHLDEVYAHDCFCHKALPFGSFQFEQPVLEFIFEAIKEKVAREDIRLGRV